MNQLKKIVIENVKGKKNFECNFVNCDVNCANLVVAPNGFGKSTIATAFEALKSNKMELDKQDYFDKNENNKPMLCIELVGENAGIYTANSSMNNISKNMSIHVINSPLFAKGKSRNFGRFSTNEAVLCVEEIVIEDKIPGHIEMSIAGMGKVKVEAHKIFFDIKSIFKNVHDMNILYESLNEIKRISNSKTSLKKIEEFYVDLNKLTFKGTAISMRNMVTEEICNKILIDDRIKNFYLDLLKCKTLPADKNNVVQMTLILVQIFESISSNEKQFKDAYKWTKYSQLKKNVDENIELFNTTNRKIKTKKNKQKLTVEFPNADEMSNGERDVITFIVQMLRYQSSFTKDIGILIIDEIFDYLDGSNILIAQYYLSKLINTLKEEGKIIFPIILTHLDPDVFNNYYFKNKKVHYLKECAITSCNEMIGFLKKRTAKKENPTISKKIEMGFIHYFNQNLELDNEEKIQITNPSYQSSENFLIMAYDEVAKYLTHKKYDPLMVICAIRVKIEERAYHLLSKAEEKVVFLETYTTSSKLDFVDEITFQVPENYYLLAPLYNDALHMDLKDNNKNQNKIKSICLKLDNLVVMKIVKDIFK